MNPLPRFLALALFVVLGVLTILLATPARSRSAPPGKPDRSPPVATAPAKVAELAQRVAFPLALTGTAIAMALAASLAFRPDRAVSNSEAVQRAEMGALTRLAETSAVQGEQLAQERDERARAQADALLHQQLLNRSLEDKIQLGRDLHDGVIQSLYAAGLTIESARAEVVADPTATERRLAQCRDTLNHTIRDIRAYIEGLAPESLRRSSFADALHALVDELGSARATQFQIELDPHASAALPLSLAAEVLQILRESISNALRHGEATEIAIRLESDGRSVKLSIRDNGRGFDPQRPSLGHGLANMRARTARLGGMLDLASSPTEGTRITVSLPAG